MPEVNEENRNAHIFLAAEQTICESRVMHQVLRSSPVIFALSLIACGGSTPPPNDSSNAKEEAGDKAATESANNEADEAGGGDEKKAPGRVAANSPAALDEERKGFMTECNSSGKLEAFCQCSWESVIKKTTYEERQDLENPNTKKALASLSTECGDKMPKDVVKQNYIQACTKMPAMGPFCECSYKFLDKKGLLTSGEEGVSRVEGEMKAACAKELQELGRKAFMEGCTTKQTATVCQCTVNALSKKYGDKLWSLLEKGGDDAKQAVRDAGASCNAK